jgi:hypothetical protein
MTDAARFPLETACRLSRSVLWRLQRRFYERRGIAAWSEGVVPHHVTCNPSLARAYVRVVLGFVRDWRDRLDPSQPLHVIELGAGSGRLAFHFLRQLEPHLEPRTAGPAGRGPSVRYVMTDLAEPNLAAWRAHPQLVPWLDAGRLDLARFDAEHDRAITLERSGEVLAPGRVANPVVVIANYVFDGLPLDGFSVADGRLHEWRVRLCSTHPDTDLDDPELLARTRLTCELRLVEPAGYYGDAALDRVLDEHRARLPDTAFTFPSASLVCLTRLAELAGGRLLVLSTDKGEVREDGLRGQAGPQLTLHGSFSIAVNYHAIARWVCALGGEALVPSDRPRTIATCGFVLGPPPGGAAETRGAYADAIEAQRPDDRFAIEQGLEPAHAALPLDQWIGYLRFTGCDPKLVADALPHLMARVGAGAAEPPAPPVPGVRDALLRVLVRSWDGYFHIGEAFDLGLALGALAAALAAWPEAIRFLEGSLRWYGPAPATLLQLAECHHRLDQHAAAQARLDEALALDPAHAPALALAARLAGRAAPALP